MPDQRLLDFIRTAHAALVAGDTTNALRALADAALHAHTNTFESIRLTVRPDGAEDVGHILSGATRREFEITVLDGRAQIREPQSHSVAQRSSTAALSVGVVPVIHYLTLDVEVSP